MIRMIEEKDYQSVADIYNYYVRTSTATFDIREYTPEEYRAKIGNILKKYPYLVYEQEGEILGFSYLSPYIDREAASISSEMAIYIRKDQRGKGIGTALIRETERIAPEYHIHTIVSVITDDNDASVRLHEKNGYQNQGHVTSLAVKNDQRLGVYIYTKTI